MPKDIDRCLLKFIEVLKCLDPFLNQFERGHHAQILKSIWDLITHSFSCDICSRLLLGTFWEYP